MSSSQQESLGCDELPGDAAVGGFKRFRVAKIPDGGMERIQRENARPVFIQRRMSHGPVRPDIGSEKNGSSAAHDPTNFGGRSGTRGEVDGHAAGLTRPGSAAIAGEFDQASLADAPNSF